MERLGKYEIRGVLGRGAMGTVYEGWDPIIARRVAIKTVRLPDSADSEEAEQIARFRQEAQAAGRLHHANVVGVFDYAETGELAYIVMEFVEGRTLKALLESGHKPPLDEVGRLMDGLLSGLAYSHAHAVIHRDVKPANTIVTASGQVKITDFGIARIESSTMTQAGTIMGTPAYMSPEQFQGSGVDARTDVYSAGVVLFQLLTGKRPFEGSMATIMQAVLNSPAPRPSALAAGIPPALDAVVAKAMARRAEDRYADAAVFQQALHAALTAPSLSPGLGDLLSDKASIGDEATIVRPAMRVARAELPSAPPPPSTRRSRKGLIAAGAAIVVVVAGLGGWLALKGGAEKPAAEQVASATPAPVATPDPSPAPIAATPPQPAPSPPPHNAAAEPPTPAAPASTLASRDTPPGPELPTHPASAPPAPSAPPIASSPPPAAAPPAAAPATDMRPPPPPAAPATTPPEPRPTAPAVTPPAPAAPIVTAAAVPLAENTKRAVAAALRGGACSIAALEEGPGRSLTVRGVVGKGQPEAGLRAAVRDSAPDAPVGWQLAAADGPYCGTLDLLRPYAEAGAGGRPLGVTLADNRTALTAEELVLPHVGMPGFPAYLQLDYLSSDGSVFHMHESVPGKPYPADAKPVFGEPRPPGFKGWAVDQPYGTDLIVGIASAAPLFRAPRPATETPEEYARELRAAVERLAREHDRLAAAVLLVRTSPRP